MRPTWSEVGSAGSQATATRYATAAQAQLMLTTYQDAVVPQAGQSIETLQSRSLTGAILFMEFLDAVRTHFAGWLKEAEARRGHGKELATPEDAIGVSIASLLDVPWVTFSGKAATVG